MLIEQRTYTLTPGGVAEYLKLYNGAARDIQQRILGNLLGLYRAETGNLNQLVFLWGFENAQERVARRQALMSDTVFTEFRKAVRHLLVSQESRQFTAI